MIFIDTFKLPNQKKINDYYADKNISVYPWTIFFDNQFEWVICKDITIFYGNNGSGKTTLLNLIAEKINAQRNNALFKDVYYERYQRITPFDDFVKEIKIKMNSDDVLNEIPLPKVRKLLTSEDVFKTIDERARRNIRTTREIDEVRDRQDDLLHKGEGYRLQSLDDFEEFEEILEARHLSATQYAKAHASSKIQMQSNGETALSIYSRAFESGGIYLLDEPENCLSPIFQIELIKLIQDSIKYFDCQFIICTHSPLLLSLKNSVIYNMDLIPVIPQKWTELENTKIYYDFFKKHRYEFED